MPKLTNIFTGLSPYHSRLFPQIFILDLYKHIIKLYYMLKDAFKLLMMDKGRQAQRIRALSFQLLVKMKTSYYNIFRQHSEMVKEGPQFQMIQIPKSKIAIRKKKWSQLRRAHTNKQRKVNTGTWRLKQTMNYILFLKQNTETLRNMLNGEKSLIYNHMATFVRTRNSLQCRSHHQKMLKTHHSVQQIINYYTKVVIPFFQREESRLRHQKWLKKVKKSQPFYQLSVHMGTIRIEIDQGRVRSY